MKSTFLAASSREFFTAAPSHLSIFTGFSSILHWNTKNCKLLLDHKVRTCLITQFIIIDISNTCIKAKTNCFFVIFTVISSNISCRFIQVHSCLHHHLWHDSSRMMSEHVTLKQVLLSATGALKGQKPGLFLVEKTVKNLNFTKYQ